MKKIYFAPETDIVKLQIESLLNIVSNGSGDVNNVTGGDDYKGTGTNVLSRENSSIWDEEEDY